MHWNQDANFVATDCSAGCRNDNLRCNQWRQSWHHDNSRSSMLPVLIRLIWYTYTSLTQITCLYLDHRWPICKWKFYTEGLKANDKNCVKDIANKMQLEFYIAIIFVGISMSRVCPDTSICCDSLRTMNKWHDPTLRVYTVVRRKVNVRQFMLTVYW